jgi:hypothetical protein
MKVELNAAQLAALADRKAPRSLYKSLHYVGDDGVKSDVEDVLETVLDAESFRKVKAVFELLTVDDLNPFNEGEE